MMTTDSTNYFKLESLLSSNDLDAFKKALLEMDFDINCNNINGMAVDTLLIRAVQVNRVNFITFLIEKEVDVNKKYNAIGDATPLHATYFYANLIVIKQLIDLGADVNAQDVWNHTPLWKFVELKHKEGVKLLLEAGADIFGRGRKDTLLSEIKNLLGSEAKFVPMGKDDKGQPVYRLADMNGKPYKTVKEHLENKIFKKHPNTNLVTCSLFKEVKSGEISNFLHDYRFATYLDKNDIRNASQVSAVRDDDTGVIINDTLLKGAKDSVDEKAVEEEMKNLFRR